MFKFQILDEEDGNGGSNTRVCKVHRCWARLFNEVLKTILLFSLFGMVVYLVIVSKSSDNTKVVRRISDITTIPAPQSQNYKAQQHSFDDRITKIISGLNITLQQRTKVFQAINKTFSSFQQNVDEIRRIINFTGDSVMMAIHSVLDTVSGRIKSGDQRLQHRTTRVKGFHLGCFADDNDRDLPKKYHRFRTHLDTVEKCINVCFSKKFMYAGLQIAWCLCGNSYGKHGRMPKCYHRCSGNTTQPCGDHWASDIYETGI